MRFVLYNLTVFILIMLLLPTRLTAQQSILDKRISISLTNISLENALDQLEAEINYSFSYKSNLIRINSIVNFNANNKTVKELLTTLINDPSISYIVIGKNIVFVKNSSIAKPTANSIRKPNSQQIRKRNVLQDTSLVSIPLPDTLTIDSTSTLEPIQFIEQIYYKPSAIYSIELFASPGFTTNKYEISNTEYAKNLDLIKKSETPLITNTAGLLMNYHRSKINIQTGIQYTSYRTQVDYNLPRVVYDSSTILKYDTSYTWEPKLVVKYYVSPSPGDTDWIAIYDTINKMNISNPQYKHDTLYKQYKHTNSFSYFEIPLNIGYTLLTTNYFTLFANAGLRAGFYIQSKGQTLSIDKENTMQSFSEISFTKINILYCISIGINYKITDRFSFVLQPYFKNNIYSIYQNSPLSIKPILYGVHIGLTYTFKDLFNKWKL